VRASLGILILVLILSNTIVPRPGRDHSTDIQYAIITVVGSASVRASANSEELRRASTGRTDGPRASTGVEDAIYMLLSYAVACVLAVD
jgi:hypothetical protein